MELTKELAQPSSLGRVGSRNLCGDTVNPLDDAPAPWIPSPGQSGSHRSTGRKRETGSEPWQPALFFEHHPRTQLASWDSHCQVVTETIGRVVPSATKKPQVSVGQIGMLILEQRFDQVLCDLDFGGRDTGCRYRMGFVNHSRDSLRAAWRGQADAVWQAPSSRSGEFFPG